MLWNSTFREILYLHYWQENWFENKYNVSVQILFKVYFDTYVSKVFHIFATAKFFFNVIFDVLKDFLTPTHSQSNQR